jgi:hypothetical protein
MMWLLESALDRINRIMQNHKSFNDRAVFEYRVSVFPRRCYNTGSWIWGRAVRGRRTITGPGEPVIEDRWYHRNEALIMMIKRNANGNI